MKRLFLLITITVLAFSLAGCKTEPKADTPAIESAGQGSEVTESESSYGIENFFKKSTEILLTCEDNENKVYSPLNVYLALSMLAEATDGNSRGQIMELLGKESIEDVRKNAIDLYNSNYKNADDSKLILANSMWLSDSIKYNESISDVLSDNYNAKAYSGEMGSDDYNKLLRDWTDKATEGMLSDYVDGLELDHNTLIALVSTVYFKADWKEPFSKSLTAEDTFHAADGDITCEFMTKELETEYFWSDNFVGTKKDFKDNGSMYLILPTDGVDLSDIAADEELYKLITDYGSWLKCKSANVKVVLPKFDISSMTDLRDSLKELGVTDVFDELKSDFTPTTDAVNGVILSTAEHTARVSVDEDGILGAAYTDMSGTYKSAVTDIAVSLKYDKPFIFVITSDDDVPLFIGVVNQP